MSKAIGNAVHREARLRHSMHWPQLLLGASGVCAAASALFGFFYYTSYWRYRGLFNEDGRYFDPHDLVVHHAQGAMLAVPACGFALLAVALFVFGRRHRRSETETP
jgi:hypothetical protein